MRSLAFCAFLLFVLIVSGCAAPAKAPATTNPTPSAGAQASPATTQPTGAQGAPSTQQPALRSFVISNTQQNGLVPDKLVVAGGAILMIRTDTRMQIINPELNISAIVEPNQPAQITVRPSTPRNLTLTCVQGCPAPKNTISVTVR